MAAKKSAGPVTEIDIIKIQKGRATFYIRGTSPFIYNAMSNKVKGGLLSPHKKSNAEKAATAKHDPPSEFRGTLYTAPTGPTLLVFPVVAFKRALASAALDSGSAKRTQVDRLVWAIGERVSMYGVPLLRMDVVRSADMNRTPDVRTRACLAEWACKIDLAFMMPAINHTVLANLLALAGDIRGVGDFRQEKGAGNFGQFQIVNDDDADWHRIVKEGGRAAQEAAVRNPVCYDGEAEALLSLWQEDTKRRGLTPKNGASHDEAVS
jgi:hypothetical protein